MNRIFASIAVLGLAATAVPIQAQDRMRMTEREAAAALRDDGLTPERDQALQLALELGPRAGPQLRSALIEAAWAEIRGETNRPPGSEARFAYMTAVARLRDPLAIPFLIEVLPNGLNASNALADLGATAFSPVMEAVAGSGDETLRGIARVSGGLTTLRFMLDDGSLGSPQIEQLRDLALTRLTSAQPHAMVVEAALRLAIALEDPRLRRTVETIATDRNVAESLVSLYLPSGEYVFTHAHDVDLLQEEARLLLSGGMIAPVRRPIPPGRDPYVR